MSLLKEEQIPLYIPASKLYGATRDSTGAGDCFTGYFVQGLMRMWDDAHASTTTLLPTREQYEALLHECVQVCALLLCLVCDWSFQFHAQAAGMCVERSGAMESIPKRGEVLIRMDGEV